MKTVREEDEKERLYQHMIEACQAEKERDDQMYEKLEMEDTMTKVLRKLEEINVEMLHQIKEMQ